MTIRAVWDLVRFHWVVLLLVTIVGMTAGYGLSSLRDTEYTASADVFVVADSRRDANDINQAATYSRDQAQNFAEVATKALVLRPVVEDGDLGLSLDEVQSRVSTSVPLNTSMISITATDTSAARAAEIANRVALSLSMAITRLVPERNGRAQVEVQSVERASVPEAPSGPPVALLTLLGGMVALALALVLLGLREFYRGKVRTAEQASEITRAPVLGTVSKERRGSRELVVLAPAHNSAHAEQYRQIRASLQSFLSKPKRNVLVVTSSVPGEGRSTAAANIAATIAASGTKVCLVEADLHRPALADALGLDAGTGFTALLTGEADLEEALQPLGADGLQVLVAGSTPYNPSELLASREAEAWLTTIRDHFEVTIIDAPPVLPVADAMTLARYFGGAIMVVSERKVRVRQLQEAVEKMALVGAPVLGTILTMSKRAPRNKRMHDRYARGNVGQVSETTDLSAQGDEGRPVTQLYHPRGSSISARVHGG